MRIQVLTNKNLQEFILPNKIDGSFTIPDSNDEKQILSIDAENNSWVMKGIENVKIISADNKMLLSSVIIEINTFYKIQLEDRIEILYVSELCDKSIQTYQVNPNSTITIGKGQNCDIKTSNEFINDLEASLMYINNKWQIKKEKQSRVYLNGSLLLIDITDLTNGACIFIYGITIVIVNNIIIMNNKEGLLVNNKMQLFNIEQKIDATKINEEIIEKNLYTDDSYFFKAPRLRRFIETYEVKIDSPPAKQETQDIPVLFLIGPMLATGMSSAVSLANVIVKLSSGEATLKEQWPTLLISIAMISTTLLWPNLTKQWQKRQRIKKEKLRQKKYSEYIETKRKCISEEYTRQQQILEENLLALTKCRELIVNRGIQLWERKIDQKDFLTNRVGHGDVPLDIDMSYQESDFVLEEDNLKTMVSDLIKEKRLLKNVPVGYSFLDNPITAIMGPEEIRDVFVDNMFLQFMAFQSYDDLKIVIFTSENNKNKYKYLKNLPHCFSNDKQKRFFITNNDEAKDIDNYLYKIYAERKNMFASSNGDINLKQCLPYYIIITDNFSKIRKLDFISQVIEEEKNYGFSIVILENRMSKLPSNCETFISLGLKESTILTNNSEKYNQQVFINELEKDNYMDFMTEKFANIPIEFADDVKMLPNSLSFLEMYNVGKIEQLNVFNRWRLNNPVNSLRAEIGANEIGDPVYLDLHEKYHGPHGLIAGMTGSGKSEFIITYVLSAALNYSPNEIAFVLIDYKGGGLAGAFDNKGNGMRLPHLAGTITNLDKSEMNRSLASIDSELRRRQAMFNAAREKLGESTIDIYKYQQFFREGKLDEPIPHLIIICDEFAELKTQQPDFMDNLISTARIGRSLGVHLILATQKPSGVVDSQIWSNTKFRVCLKVQDKSDSNEMLKRPEAAELKQVGRFYLQVGYNELFLLGQSGWAGAKYFPSDSSKKEIDKSINFIDNIGNIVQSISSNTNTQKVSSGEQLAQVLSYIVNTAKRENIYSRKLWLDAIPHKIFIKDIVNKYQFKESKYNINAVIGEYDDPNNQVQNIYTINLTNEGNTIVYGVNGSDKEMLLNSLIFSTCAFHTPEEINYYIIDFGSEAMRLFSSIAHIGDMVFLSDVEKIANLFKMIGEEIENRKKMFVEYSGKYTSYIAGSGKSLPLITVIINDYDTFIETNSVYEDLLLQYSRDGQRYGIVFILTVNALNAIRHRMKQNFHNEICLELNDPADYTTVFGRVKNSSIASCQGRGLMKKEDIHEFQTSLICEEEELSDFIREFAKKQQDANYKKAKCIPILPEIVDISMLKDSITTLENVPVGMNKQTLDVNYYNFLSNISTSICSLELDSSKAFIHSLLAVFRNIQNIQTMIIDANKLYEEFSKEVNFYYNTNLLEIIKELNNYIDKMKASSVVSNYFVCLLVGIDKITTKIDEQTFKKFVDNASSIDNFKFILVSDDKAIKKVAFDSWYKSIYSNSDGIWVGNGIIDQTVIKISNISKEMKVIVDDTFGWVIKSGIATTTKLVTGKVEENNEK